MSAGTNTANTLTHDLNAGRYQAVTIPQYHSGQDIGDYLMKLGAALQLAEAKRVTQATEIQRAFRTIGSGQVEVLVLKDWTASASATNITKTYIPVRVFAIGATNQSTISGSNCT